MIDNYHSQNTSQRGKQSETLQHHNYIPFIYCVINQKKKKNRKEKKNPHPLLPIPESIYVHILIITGG